jgi:hypothetical protein
MSSCESELYAMTSGSAELLYVRSWLEEQGVAVSRATVWSDSSSAIAVAYKRGTGTRLKHIAIRDLALQQWVQESRLSIAKVPTEQNVSDFLTKCVSMTMMKVGCVGAQIGPA